MSTCKIVTVKSHLLTMCGAPLDGSMCCCKGLLGTKMCKILEFTRLWWQYESSMSMSCCKGDGMAVCVVKVYHGLQCASGASPMVLRWFFQVQNVWISASSSAGHCLGTNVVLRNTPGLGGGSRGRWPVKDSDSVSASIAELFSWGHFLHFSAWILGIFLRTVGVIYSYLLHLRACSAFFCDGYCWCYLLHLHPSTICLFHHPFLISQHWTT